MAKATKKAAVKKSTKGTKKATKKGAKGKASNGNGLTGTEVAILKALKGTKVGGKEMAKVELKKKSGLARVPAKVIGAATREGAGVQGGGLIGKGYVVGNRYEDSRGVMYAITAKGRTALSKAG